MITLRRELLDRVLSGAVPLMRGKVLDIGGKKSGKRGAFRPPLAQVESWSYLNPDASTDPDFLCGSEAIPVEAGRFDTAIMTEVLEYLPDAAATFREAHRVLARGGRFLITVPFLSPVHGDWQFDRQRFTEVKLRELASGAGFQVEKVETMGSLGSVIHDILHIAIGYARDGSRPARIRAALLRLSAPVFRMLDALTRKQGRFVHTGYFLVLLKPEGGPA